MPRKKKRLIIDTNVWLALFLGDEPFKSDAVGMFIACDRNKVDLLYFPTSAKDVFFITQRELKRRERAEGASDSCTSYSPAAWACVERMSEMATAVPLGFAECELARMLRAKHDDFEDNLLLSAADGVDADCLATFDHELIEKFPALCAHPKDVPSRL